MSVSAYPLAWPPGWPRTDSAKRERWPSPKPPTVAPALTELQAELRRFGATGVVLSSNVSLGAETPSDPGVVAYFTYDRMQVALPCDRWSTVGGNLRAIAKHIEAMRGMERWGARHMFRAMFQGFTALPAAGPGQRPWRDVLGLANDYVDRGVILNAYTARAKRAHPDAGGTHDAMAALNAARDEALREMGG